MWSKGLYKEFKLRNVITLKLALDRDAGMIFMDVGNAIGLRTSCMGQGKVNMPTLQLYIVYMVFITGNIKSKASDEMVLALIHHS